jgi:DNA ligase-1
MLFSDFVSLCRNLERTRKRNEKKELIARFLLALNKDELISAVSFLIGRVFPESDQRILDVGYKTLSRSMNDLQQTTLVEDPLTILRVNHYFTEISSAKGTGSRKRKEKLLQNLFNKASSLERTYLARLIMGEMRIGAVEGIVLESIATATSIPLDLLRRGSMLRGDVGEIAQIALIKGRVGIEKISISLFTPIKPMLAGTSYDLKEIFLNKKRVALEYKFDGVRIQIHIKDAKVRIFSRHLSDVTPSLPDVVSQIREKISAREAVLEGEVVAYGDEHKPLPFQDVMRRFRRVHDVHRMITLIPLKLHLFDLLYVNGQMLIDQSYQERWKTLMSISSPDLLSERIITENIAEAETFLTTAMRAGHEGLVIKSLTSKYTPGVRGKNWLKMKPFESLDLVIIAADWGYGRRRRWLSNYYLAALNPTRGEFELVGKTFKGLTDEEFEKMTQRLLALKKEEVGYTIHVKPEIVVEVAFNEIQKSSQYFSGFALRFARITKIREDKGVMDADTLQHIRDLYEIQFKFKGKLQL